MQNMKMEEVEAIIDAQLRTMANEEVRLDNKLFSMQAQKTKQIANLAGKKISAIGMQLFANQLGASVAVPSLGIKEGEIIKKLK